MTNKNLFGEAVSKRRGMSTHETPTHKTKDEWLTPPGLIKSLGEFDLDPCSPVNRPWDTATRHYTEYDNGLSKPWAGRVWCNPPYSEWPAWIGRLADHGDGIALIFAGTETDNFFRHVWRKAHGLLFISGRLKFHHVDGRAAGASAGAPSVLVAFGAFNVTALRRSGIAGAFVDSVSIQGNAP